MTDLEIFGDHKVHGTKPTLQTEQVVIRQSFVVYP